MLERETLGVIETAIEELPEAQREVIRLRDVEGWTPMEVADALEISDGNQRVLLHRARSKVRAALETYLNPELLGDATMSLFTREMACQELVELVTAYFDGSLSRSDRRRFRVHISGCEHCTAYLEQMRLVIEATGRLTEDDIDPAAREELLEAFRGWKDARS